MATNMRNRNAEEEEEIFLVWSEMLQILHPITSKLPAHRIELVANILGTNLYLSYNPQNEFLPQLKTRLEDIKLLAAELEEIIKEEKWTWQEGR